MRKWTRLDLYGSEQESQAACSKHKKTCFFGLILDVKKVLLRVVRDIPDIYT